MKGYIPEPGLHHHVAAWVFVLLTLLLLFMSLMGDGYGAMDSGFLRGMFWSYILLAVGVVLLFWIFLPPRKSAVRHDAAHN
ncbi:MAG: hypothetical protein HYT80_02495 [Euryarchaeota archaeon]|nr:hypothetical protein [Euryarchaeota archaeon]